jgi:nitroreductase
MAARKRQALKNFEFFGAPVGLFFFTERAQKLGAFLDTALYMQNVMTLARAHGLETCPQAAWVHYGTVVRRTLGLDDKLLLVCGMSLGYEDTGAPANRLTTERAPLESFVTWHG